MFIETQNLVMASVVASRQDRKFLIRVYFTEQEMMDPLIKRNCYFINCN